MPDNTLTDHARQIVTAKDNESAAIMETVIASGDLAALNPQQRLRFYMDTCQSLGLNPYTRPFEYLRLSGKLVLYARRDCADQLRKIRGISLAVVDKRVDDDLFIVTVRATESSGRTDEDFGAVLLGNLRGEARANAMLKAITKAKRRVTLSICGLGMNDESEVDDIPGAQSEPSAMPPLEVKAVVETTHAPLATTAPKRTFREWLAEIVGMLAQAQTVNGVEAIEARADVAKVMASGGENQQQALLNAIADARLRIGEMMGGRSGVLDGPTGDPEFDGAPDAPAADGSVGC